MAAPDAAPPFCPADQVVLGAVTGLPLLVLANEGSDPFVKTAEDHFRERLRAFDLGQASRRPR